MGNYENENVYCPELIVVDCADTDEHNKTVIEVCSGNHHKCILQGQEDIHAS